jgi:LemA family
LPKRKIAFTLGEKLKNQFMEIVKKFWWIGLLAVIVLWAMGSYNGIVSKEVEVNRAWADVESDYQRRSDLIPNLVSTVKGYANFEQETLTKVMLLILPPKIWLLSSKRKVD